MLKNLLVTTALSGLMFSSALAQSSSPSSPSSPSMSSPPAASSSPSVDPMKSDAMKSDSSKASTSTTSSVSTTGASASTISSQKPDQLLASKIKGADVIGGDGKKIGDVSDILFSKDGKLEAYILSVGGFLGVGAKEVALAPSSIQLSQEKDSWQLKVSMTKDQLAQAPNFERHKERPATTGAASSGMGSSAPKNAPLGSASDKPPAQKQ